MFFIYKLHLTSYNASYKFINKGGIAATSYGFDVCC
jgi:hypothetical protein